MEIPNFMKIFIGIIIIVFMVAIFWLTSWQSKIDERKKQDEQVVKLEGDIRQANEDKAKIEELRRQVNELNRQLDANIQQKLTSESETDFVPSYMADVEKLVEQQRIRMNDPDFIITAMTPGTKSDNTSAANNVLASYPARSFQMSLTGRYTTIIDFLRQLGALKLKRLVTVSKLTLNGSPDTTNYSRSPKLTITMPISVYLRKEGN
jgi:Tfp pilus assembly protein PilO